MSGSRAALLVGAGDAIGAAVARRFAVEGYKVCIARRDASKAQPLVDEMAAAGRDVRAYSVDARQEAQVRDLCEQGRTRCRTDRSLSLQRRCKRSEAAARDDRRAVLQGMGVGLLRGLSGRPRGDEMHASSRARVRCCLPEPRPVFAVARGLQPSPPPSSACARSLNRWRANWARRTSTLFISFSTVPSTVQPSTSE